MRGTIRVALLALLCGCGGGWWIEEPIECADGERFSEKKGDCVELVCPEGEVVDPSFPHRCIAEEADSGVADGAVGDAGGCQGAGCSVECDGAAPTTWYQDADGDGLGDPAATLVSCSQPEGYVENDDDPYPTCEREQPAQCTGGDLRCGEGDVLGAREICIEAEGCTEWQPASSCGEAAPKCMDGACGACTEDADCERFGKICDDGQCVQCTAQKTGACGGFVCDSRNRTCATGVLPMSAELCEPCVADAQCGKRGPSLCLPTSFDGQDLGYFCQPKLSQGESCIVDHRPYAAAAVDDTSAPLSSIDGATDASCKLAQTTCAALGDFRNKGCSGLNDDDACGAEGLDDGQCAAVPGQGVFQCSVPCVSSVDCNAGSTCPPGGGTCSL